MASNLERPLTAPHPVAASRLQTWTLDIGQQRLLRDNEEHVLDPKAQSVLLHLIERAPHVVSLEEILSRTWPRMVVTDNVVYRAISGLRCVLGDNPARPTYIETVAKRGYRLLAPIDVRPKPDPLHQPPPSFSTATDRTICVDAFVERGRITGRRVRAMDLQEELQTLLISYPELRSIATDRGSRRTDYIVSGTVSHEDRCSTLRLGLTRTIDDQLIWSRKFDLSEIDSPKIVGRFLRLQLVHDHECERVRQACTSPDAARLFRLARAEQYRISQDGNFDPQLEMWNIQRAACLDPEIPEIQKLLSDSYLWASVFRRLPRDEASIRAHDAISRALAMQPDYPAALVGLAAVQTVFDFDYRQAELNYRKAIQLDPNVLFAHNGLGEIEAYLGHPSEAVEHYSRAVRVFDGDARIFTEYARCLNTVGDYTGAVNAAREGLALVRSGCYLMLLAAEEVYAHICLGNRDSAVRAARVGFEAAAPTFKPCYAAPLAEAGLTEMARAMLSRLGSARTPITACCMVRACLTMNRIDDAFRWLARATEIPDTLLLSEIRCHPRYAELREDRRWEHFAEALSEAQQST